ncbi:hypothetical protein J3Q64DRAFT_1738036 [Phycomyces blakesleeanus]|uniref:Ubiquitin-like protease family profile domain-containing protein n=1 Tax=Phycomyces blakesleeanus TaxID=4837 RepID=A0ABR3B1Q8_PHYBL
MGETDLSNAKPNSSPTTISPQDYITITSSDEDETMVESEMIFTYPPKRTRTRDQIMITRRDEKKLQDGEYLNDNLIDFFLTWSMDSIATKQKSPLKTDVHVFNCFFYQDLLKKVKTCDLDGLKKWGSKVDLFKKKHIVIPVNERNHWILMIAVNVDQCVFPSKAKRSPHIYVLNSLGVCKNNFPNLLIEYLKYEARIKHGVKEQNFVCPTYSNPPVLRQTNNFDCGIYMIHFAQVFFKRPNLFKSLIDTHPSKGMRWGAQHLPYKRDALRDVIRRHKI